MPKQTTTSAAPMLKRYSCDKGHVYQDFEPWQFGIVVNGEPYRTGPLCPFCWVAFMAAAVPTTEQVIEQPVVELPKRRRKTA